MTNHKLIYEHDRDQTCVRALCVADADANCRLRCPHDCEWISIERDEHGPFHMVDTFDELFETNQEPLPVRHDLVSGPACHVVDWLNEDASLIPELNDPYQRFEIGTIDIDVKWVNGDEIMWAKVEESS